MDIEFKNEARDQYNGLRIGDSVDVKDTSERIIGKSEVLGFDSKDKEKVFIKNKSGMPIEWSAKQLIVTIKIEDKTELAPADLKPEEIVIDQATADKKRKVWGELGVKIYESELKRQARAQLALKKLIIPTKIEDIPNAVIVLKEVKAELNAIVIDRKETTDPLSNKVSELMAPEKSFAVPISNFEAAMLKIRKDAQEKEAADKKKNDELNSCREFLTITRNNTDASFKSKVIEKVNNAYELALGKLAIEVGEEGVYIDIAISKFKHEEFTVVIPKNTFPLVPADVYETLTKEILNIDTQIYLADYENQLRTKFSDYEVAVNNKATALNISQNETIKKTEEVKAQATNANVGVKLETVSMSYTPTVMSPVKNLNYGYEIDMPEDAKSVVTIMSAFAMHIDLCMPKLNVNKWWAFTASQAGIALCKVKKDNEAFAPVGIIFKKVDKLR